MFYFDDIKGYKILRSDCLKDINAFFTTRGCPLPEEGEKFEIKNEEGKKKLVKKSPYFNEPLRILSPEQTHSDYVAVVDEKEVYTETDGLILSEPNTLIYLRFADCTPLIFYDKIAKIAAISHAGWRGTAAGIGVKTVAKMVLNYSSKPEDIVAVIGPAISKCCYEVSEEVRDNLLGTVKNTEGLYKGRNVDLKQINARQLEEIGVKNIDICPYCTSCNNDLFYSYRKENGTQERHFAVVRL